MASSSGNGFMENHRQVVDDLHSADLVSVIEGDTAHFEAVLATPHQLLQEAARHLPPLVVTRQAVLRVIESPARGEIAPQQAQEWASLMRRGYARQSLSTPIKPIDIGYELPHEEVLAEVIARLDEIGDAVDGLITGEELEVLRNLLLIEE
jgi:hypothetical protein